MKSLYTLINNAKVSDLCDVSRIISDNVTKYANMCHLIDTDVHTYIDVTRNKYYTLGVKDPTIIESRTCKVDVCTGFVYHRNLRLFVDTLHKFDLMCVQDLNITVNGQPVYTAIMEFRT